MDDATVPPRHVNFGPFELDVRSGELRKGSARLRVPDQSIEILKALVEHPGELVTREQLRERLWPANTFVDFEHGLNAAIRRLRDALGDSADSPKYIETLPRRGYRFIGSVGGVPTFVAAPQGSVRIESLSAEGRIEAPARTFVNIGRLTAWHLAVIVLIVLTVGIGLYSMRRASDRLRDDAAAAVRSIPVTSLPGWEIDPSLSPDGNWVAFAWDGDSDNFDIYVKRLDVGAGPIKITTDGAEDRDPAWSPDGQSIAFVRRHANDAVAIVVAFPGGPERRLTGITGLASGLSWTPDGKSLVFVGRDVSSASSAVFSYSLETGKRQQLTQSTPVGIPDTRPINMAAAPVVSPDGNYLAFIERSNIVVERLEALRPVGGPKQLTDRGRVSSLTWAHDSGSIIYDIGGHPNWGEIPEGLWRVPIAKGQATQLFSNVRASSPSVDRNGHLVYQNTTADKNIWSMPGPQQHREAESEPTPKKFIASNAFDMSPQISPDGLRIVFVSVRSGFYELWLADTDRPATPQQLTKFKGAFVGSPRWSANGDSIVFDSTQSGSFNIWVVAADGTGVHPITSDSSINVRPSWSRDGRWIYFSSQRSGDWQIWKVPASGGEPVQVTKKGPALEAFESPDRKHLYYAKPATLPGIWRVPVDGGEEIQVIDHGLQGWWAVIDGGIVLMNKLARPQATVEYFSFDTARITWTRRLPAGLKLEINPGFSVSRDGHWVLFVQFDNWGSDINMLQ